MSTLSNSNTPQPSRKRKLLDFALILVLTLCLAFSANRVMDMWLFKVSFPESIALDDVYWEDFAFKLRPNTNAEDRILLVNIGQNRRREIADQILQVSKCKPRVIGLDVYFNCTDGKRDSINCPQLLDTLGNRKLSETIRDAGNVVMVSKLLQTDLAAQDSLEEKYDSMEVSDESFTRFAHQGFANQMISFTNSIKNGEIRYLMPQATVNEKNVLNFAARIAFLYDSVKARKFLERNQTREWISFRGSVTPYHYELGSKTVYHPPYLHLIDSDSLARGLYPVNTFEGKIVLIGYAGDYLNDENIEDRYYTPLNPTFAGRSLPDMLSLYVHANIISMILNEDYINELGDVLTLLITMALISINIQFFIWLYRKQPVWYDSLCFIIPIFQIVLYSWLRLELLASFNFRVDFEGLIYLIAFVSFAVNFYYGPLVNMKERLTLRFHKQ